ncbi:MAG: helix-turn-helix domain-containing protein [Candidatus Sumerlaeia bacterium]
MPHLMRTATWMPQQEFPLSVRRIEEHRPTSVHQHEFTELVLILSGKGVHVVGKEKYHVGEGDVFIINGDLGHAYEDTQKLHLINILFELDRLHIHLDDIRTLPGYHVLFELEPRHRKEHQFKSHLHLPMEDMSRIAQMAARMEKELEDEKPGYRFISTGILIDIIGFLCRACSRARTSNTRPLLRIGDVIAHLEKNYREPVSVEELARISHLSERSLLREFQKVVGHSPIDYLIRLRVRNAARHIQAGADNITNVAFENGFSDSNYFSRQFHKIMGISPTAFRKMPTRKQNRLLQAIPVHAHS